MQTYLMFSIDYDYDYDYEHEHEHETGTCFIRRKRYSWRRHNKRMDRARAAELAARRSFVR
jgi:hypothetical protein